MGLTGFNEARRQRATADAEAAKKTKKSKRKKPAKKPTQ